MTTEISSDILKACQLLKSGEVVAVPTETVYGLAANGLNPIAVRQIFEIKERPAYNPLILHFSCKEDALTALTYVPEWAYELMKHFWPGPLTLVLPKALHIPDIVTSGKGTVAVRVPAHPMMSELLKNLDFPLAAPSANLFGKISPTLPEHVYHDLNRKIPLILDGGQCECGIESTIIGMGVEGSPLLLRKGSVSRDMLEAVIGKIEAVKVMNEAPLAPGMLKKHYAPDTCSFLVKDPDRWLSKLDHNKFRIGVIRFVDNQKIDGVFTMELSPKGNMNEAARQLYKVMHEMDKLRCDFLLFEAFPEIGLGPSINDKLKRATKPLIQLRKYIEHGLTSSH